MRRLVMLIALAGASACQDSTTAEASAEATPSAAVSQPPPMAPPPPPIVGELHGFAPTEVISVSFKEISEKGYPMVMLHNLTGRDIETIRGAFQLHDGDGNLLHSTGLTIAVPGTVFVPADADVESSPYGLNARTELMQRLTDAPDELSFSFEAADVTFLDADS